MSQDPARQKQFVCQRCDAFECADYDLMVDHLTSAHGLELDAVKTSRIMRQTHACATFDGRSWQTELLWGIAGEPLVLAKYGRLA